jgi:ribosomal-protein-alanine N-acetyltransferase
MLDINLHPFPVINTTRLTLRTVNFGDATALFAMRTDAGVLKYIDINIPKSIEDVNNWIKMILDLHQKNDGVLWALSLHGHDEMIGSIGIWQMDKVNHRAEIGYMLATAHQGKGYMQEALIEAIKYTFECVNLHAIEATVHPGNQASINLLERNGFVREGYYRDKYYNNGKFIDSATYSLITTIK